MYIPIFIGTTIFNLETLLLKFNLLSKNVNLGHSFLTIRDRALIFHMYMSLWQDLLLGTKFYDLLTLTFNVDLLLKITLTLAIASLPEEVGFLYFTCTYLVTWPFMLCHDLWPSNLDLEIRPYYEKCRLVHNLRTRKDRVLIFHMCILMIRPCTLFLYF